MIRLASKLLELRTINDRNHKAEATRALRYRSRHTRSANEL